MEETTNQQAQTTTVNNSQPNKKKVRWGRISIVAIVLLLIVLIIPLGSQSIGQRMLNMITGNAIGSGIAATVDNQKITISELNKEYEYLDVQLKSYYTKASLLNELVQEILILEEAKKSGIIITDENFNSVISNLEVSLEASGSSLSQIASQRSLSLDELKSKLREQLVIKEYIDKNVYVKNIGEEEAKAFFNQNKDNLKTKDMVNISHILVKTKEEADQILKDIKDGKSFEQIATEKSLDIGTKSTGGNLGFFPKGVMVTEFENAAFSLKDIGELSEPIKTDFGYHILRLDGKQAAGDANYEDIKDQIIEALQQSENQKQLSAFRSKLLEDAILSGRVKILYKEN